MVAIHTGKLTTYYKIVLEYLKQLSGKKCIWLLTILTLYPTICRMDIDNIVISMTKDSSFTQ